MRNIQKVQLKNKQSQKLPPNFIGRLATTIIIEDGLYMG